MTVVSYSNNMVIYVVSEKILCSEVACKNGASCNDTDTGYICDCVAGYTGSLCETGKYDSVPRSLDDAYPLIATIWLYHSKDCFVTWLVPDPPYNYIVATAPNLASLAYSILARLCELADTRKYVWTVECIV